MLPVPQTRYTVQRPFRQGVGAPQAVNGERGSYDLLGHGAAQGMLPPAVVE